MEDYYLHYKYERDGNTKFQFGKFRKLDKSLMDGHVSLNEVYQDPGISNFG